jgi:DNA-binding NtrC family response regulator
MFETLNTGNDDLNFSRDTLDALRAGVAPAGRQHAHRVKKEPACFGDLYGESDVMQDLFRLLDKVAGSDAIVLIKGESGTGKELVASTLHKMSPLAGQPFVAINCGAFPANLVEAELFGHERGGFTGAVRCFSTRSRKCPWTCRSSCSACWRRAGSAESAATRRSRSRCV